MHRQIMRPAAGQQVHHINSNSLDNRESNLQIVTPQRHAAIHQARRIMKSADFGLTGDIFAPY
ncbi:MAG: HNH endonuclease [Chloroflexota bacterium]|nr:HNH endonuclease [Chloroflexota bacterium]